MRRLCRNLGKRNNLRLVFAALFLFVLLAEVSFHVPAHTGVSHQEEQLVSVLNGSENEPCRHVLPCCDNGHPDKKAPNAGHQLMHNDLLDVANFLPKAQIERNPKIPFNDTDVLFRESSPPFHPPRLS